MVDTEPPRAKSDTSTQAPLRPSKCNSGAQGRKQSLAKPTSSRVSASVIRRSEREGGAREPFKGEPDVSIIIALEMERIVPPWQPSKGCWVVQESWVEPGVGGTRL